MVGIEWSGIVVELVILRRQLTKRNKQGAHVPDRDAH